jgi:lipid-A-disaccharide synthase
MTAKPPRVFLVSGERSGDAHGAALARDLLELLPGLEIRGLGGPLLAAATNGGVDDWVEEAGVLGLVEVLKKYGWFARRMEETVAEINRWQPDAVVFIDYPGFNLRLANRLQPLRPRIKLVYYISPQVWAWNRGRIPRMAALLDRMLCIFPFEKEMYEQSGLPTEFIGHPLVDELAPELAKPVERDPGLAGWFPGSRRREIDQHFPVMLGAIGKLAQSHPHLRHMASAASDRMAEPMRAMLESAGLADKVDLVTGNSRHWMRRCGIGAVASGTATLEAAFMGLPYCLVYKVARSTYLVGRMLVRVPYLGIANILAGKCIVPEFIQDDLTPEALAAWVGDRLAHPEEITRQQEELAAVVASLGGPGAHHRAARAVAEAIGA